jgi:hypothetical protein
MAQGVEQLPGKHKALSSNPNTTKKKKKPQIALHRNLFMGSGTKTVRLPNTSDDSRKMIF